MSTSPRILDVKLVHEGSFFWSAIYTTGDGDLYSLWPAEEAQFAYKVRGH